MIAQRIKINAGILAGRAREVCSFARDSFNLGLALQDWRQAHRNRGNPDAIFMWVPKTAGYSIFNVLGRFGAQKLTGISLVERYFENRGIVTFGHIRVLELLEKGYVSDEFWNSAWKFAFVRNPYARAVSLYKYLKRVQLLPATTNFRIFCSFLEERAFEPIGLHNSSGLSMMNPQVAWLTNENGGVLPDYICKVRDSDEGYRTIVRELKLQNAPARLPHDNRSPDRLVASYYNDHTRAIVAEAYAQDFETFGFDPAFMPE